MKYNVGVVFAFDFLETAMDYREYMVNAEELSFTRADPETARILGKLFSRNKTAMIMFATMVLCTGIVAAVFLRLYMGFIAGMAVMVLGLMVFGLIMWYALKKIPAGEYTEFELVRLKAVSIVYRKSNSHYVDLWSEEQKKCIEYKIVRNGNRICEGVEGYFVHASSAVSEEYLFVTDHDYKILEMSSGNRS